MKGFFPERDSASNKNIVGVGGEKTVYAEGAHLDKIRAVYRLKKTDEEIKATYYFGKILWLLFPEGVPQIHKAGNERPESGGKSMYIAERVEISEELQRVAELNKRFYLDKKGLDRVPHRFKLDDGEGEELQDVEDFFYTIKHEIKILNELNALKVSGVQSGSFPDTGNAGNVSSFEEDAHYLDLTSPFAVGGDRVRWKVDLEELKVLIGRLDDAKKRLAEVCYARMVLLFQDAVQKVGERE